MAKRKYIKNPDNPWWNKGKLKSAVEVAMSNPPVIRQSPVIDYELGGEATAAQVANQEYRDGQSPVIQSTIQFRNVAANVLPWESTGGYRSVSTAMLLMQRAYASIPVYRNAVEGAVEFSNSPLHIKTDNKTVRDFFTSLFNRWKIHKLKDMWFRNHYREGNDFWYRHMGRIEDTKYAQMKSVFGAKSPYIPIRYTLLNPTQVYLSGGVYNNGNYVKMLSQYEILQLRNPRTPEDKQIFNSLPEQTKREIMKGNSKEIFIPLDETRLICTFYKKQDFEPMAIPMGYPLLPDFDWKLELEKQDKSILQSLEQVLLLVTNGEKTEQWGGGGINPQNIANLQNLFRNKTLGRVLVADYTTKVEWKIPDIAAILGPEKYVQVEKNIQNGLQTIFVGEDKYANASMKAKIYTERMKEGQKVFLNDFLLPEVQYICEAMGFRDVPEIEFEQIDLDDTSQRERVLLRLAELGILTPDEIFEALESGVLPDKESNLRNQEEYKKARDKEFYTPLIGGAKEKQQDGGEGRPGGSGIKKVSNKPGKIGVTKAEEIAATSVLADTLLDSIEAIFKKKLGVEELSTDVKAVSASVAKSIMVYEPADKWISSVRKYLKDPKEINAACAKLITDTAIEYDVDDWSAIIITKVIE